MEQDYHKGPCCQLRCLVLNEGEAVATAVEAFAVKSSSNVELIDEEVEVALAYLTHELALSFVYIVMVHDLLLALACWNYND